jgi:stage II sporulation protein D
LNISNLLNKLHRPLLSFFCMVVCFAVLLPAPASLAAPAASLDSIRVSLFIDQRGTLPAVTLSHGQNLKLSAGNLQTAKHWITVGKKLRASIDTYKVKLLETKDYQAASTLSNGYIHPTDRIFIFTKQVKGQLVYEVYAGSYASLQEAEQAKQRLVTDPKIAPFIQGSPVKLIGPRHVSVGSYANEDEAANKQTELLQHGISAFIVYQENTEGTLMYSVWVGEEADDNAMADLKSKILTALPATVFSPADTALPYLIRRAEMLSGGTTVPHYSIGTDKQRLIVEADQAGIQVSERYDRTYRGKFEIRVHNGKLALVNELPFEEYLYAVVSTEMGGGFPLESLKAQAVAARTYALTLGVKYGVAHISDTTYDQAYKGLGSEIPLAVQAVQETDSEVLMNQAGLIVPFYSSNAGGMSAETSEVWGTPLSYIQSVSSPDDVAQKNKLDWHRAVMPDGSIGFIRSDFTEATNLRNSAGLPIYKVNTDGVNVRKAPYVDNVKNPAIYQVKQGDELIVFDTTVESNAYAWIRGPYTSEEVKKMIGRRISQEIPGELTQLKVTERGPSGRVMEIQANGQKINVSTPDGYRTVFDSLPSTRFEIEQISEMTVLGAGGGTTLPSTAALYALQGQSGTPKAIQSQDLFIMNAEHKVRLASRTPQYRFIGNGFGHGIGMSQWGAKGLVDTLGYDYQQILKYYYKDVNIVKG